MTSSNTWSQLGEDLDGEMIDDAVVTAFHCLQMVRKLLLEL